MQYSEFFESEDCDTLYTMKQSRLRTIIGIISLVIILLIALSLPLFIKIHQNSKKIEAYSESINERERLQILFEKEKDKYTQP